MSLRARTRRIEAMMHVLLVDHGYRRLSEGEPGSAESLEAPADGSASPGGGSTANGTASPSPSRLYVHATRDAWALLERIGNPHLPVAVTLYAERPPRLPLRTIDRPELLRDLLERGYT